MSKLAIQDSAPRAASNARPQASDEEIADLIVRAVSGDPTALPAVQALLAEEKLGQTLVDSVGSPAEWLRQSLLQEASGGVLLVQEALRRKLDAVLAELEGESPTPIERLLAERASLCWMMVYLYESTYAHAEGCPKPQAEVQQLRIDRAHARFLSAVRTLAQVRKLAVPALQVNIARHQVNVVGGGS